MIKKGFFIELDFVPRSDEEICLGVAKYCGKNNYSYDFLRRTSPIIAIIDGSKYEIVKKYQHVRSMNCWVLKCREID